MQTQTIYVRAGSVLATWVDSANQTSSASFPTLARGQRAELVIGFFKDENADSIMTQAEVQQYVSWDFAYDSDYSTATTPKIRTTEGFFVDEGGYLHIPIDTGTEELRTAIGTSESITLSAELDGYLAGEPDAPALIIQWNGQPFRNRIIEGGTGTPVPVDDGTYTKAQVNALVSGEIVYQFSEDGATWHDTQTETDVWFRSRNSVIETVAWSAPMKLPAGVAGKPGEPGKPGAPGADGFSPSAKVEQAGGATTITITDKDGTTTATIQNSGGGGGGGTVDAYTKAETDALLGNYALKADAATDHNHDRQYLRLAGGTLTGSLTAPSIAVTGSITEGGTALSSKYATKSHSHAMSDVTGLQSALNGKAASSHTHGMSDVTGLQDALNGKAATTHTHAMSDVTGLQDALDAKADADAVPSSCVTYAETLPTPSGGAPGCVIVTGATSGTQTRGHVYSLMRHEQSITRDLNVSFSTSVFTSGVFRVYGSGSDRSGGTTYEYDLAWISSHAGAGTNVGDVILFKRKGSDTRWYLHSPSGSTMWRCTDDRCLDISDPLGLSGMTFGHPEGATTTLTITDAGTGSPTIDFVCRGETTNLYRIEDYEGKPQWRGKETQSGMAVVHLRYSYDKWRLGNDRDVNPTAVYITSTAASPLDESGKEWTVYEESSGVIGNFPVTITERPLPSEVSWSYEDITVQELESLRSSLTALEARVAALEAPSA